MRNALAVGLIAIFVALAALHVFWAAGGRAGVVVAIPRSAGRPLFTPGPLSTLAVAGALVVAALATAAAVGWLGYGTPLRIGRPLAYALALVFALRAVGDFRFVGFFKSMGEAPFRSWDTWLFSPLCAVIAAAAFLVARQREP